MRVGKIKKSTKKFEVEKLVRVVLRGKTVMQQYSVKTLNGNKWLLLLLLFRLLLLLLTIDIIMVALLQNYAAGLTKLLQCHKSR